MRTLRLIPDRHRAVIFSPRRRRRCTARTMPLSQRAIDVAPASRAVGRKSMPPAARWRSGDGATANLQSGRKISGQLGARRRRRAIRPRESRLSAGKTRRDEYEQRRTGSGRKREMIGATKIRRRHDGAVWSHASSSQVGRIRVAESFVPSFVAYIRRYHRLRWKYEAARTFCFPRCLSSFIIIIIIIIRGFRNTHPVSMTATF